MTNILISTLFQTYKHINIHIFLQNKAGAEKWPLSVDGPNREVRVQQLRASWAKDRPNDAESRDRKVYVPKTKR